MWSEVGVDSLDVWEVGQAGLAHGQPLPVQHVQLVVVNQFSPVRVAVSYRQLHQSLGALNFMPNVMHFVGTFLTLKMDCRLSLLNLMMAPFRFAMSLNMASCLMMSAMELPHCRSFSPMMIRMSMGWCRLMYCEMNACMRVLMSAYGIVSKSQWNRLPLYPFTCMFPCHVLIVELPITSVYRTPVLTWCNL